MVLGRTPAPRPYRILAAPCDCSSSRPRSRWLVARRRCDSMSTSSIRILAPSSGCSTMMRARFSRSSTAISVGAAARQVAKRGWPSIIDISPSVRPASTEARSCGVFQRSRLCTSTVPSSTISMKSPPSPSRMISAPGPARYTAMKWASSCTSAGEKFSSSVHLGISVSICPANWVASPRYSRWTSCCGRSGMGGFAPDYAETLLRVLTAAQDDVAVVVAAGLDDLHLPALVHREEMVLLARGEQRVDGDLHVAVGAVLEAHRRREPGGELAVYLALGGARADRPPGDQVADVLRRDDVEELAARGHARLVDAHQKIARDAQALVDAEAAVEIRIVDQAFPPHRGARLLEVHAHQDFEFTGTAFSLFSQFF